MEIEHLVPINKLKTTLLAKAAQEQRTPVFVDYDKRFDALVMTIVPLDQETVVHYVDEHVALLYLPETLEIVGLQIEDFEYSFVPNHESLRKIWRLSDSGIQLDNLGDMMFTVERMKPEIAREVVKAAEDILGGPGADLVAVFA